MSALDNVLGRLEGVKKTGDGFQARCPSHEDRHPSLSIGVGDDGRVLLKCQAGCDTADVLAAIDLKPADLFEHQERDEIVATYDYVDEQGALLYQVVRKANKKFLQRRPDGRGDWIWKLDKTRRVLYRLPRVAEAVAAGATIYIAEGEKDVHALEKAGVVATCNAMGAGKWRKEYAKVLQAADVVVVADRDDAGREHAAKVANSLVDVASSVRIVEAAEGKDAADHLAAGHTVDDFITGTPPEGPESRKTPDEPAQFSEKFSSSADRKAPVNPPALASEPDILGRFRGDLRLAGVAGEQTLGQLVYLAVTSRVQPWGKPTERPVSVVPKGSTSTGKSHATRTTLRFFPSSAWIDLGSMSRKYLFYSDEEYAHRFIYISEWASIKDDEELVALIRVLLSEGHIVHGTVDTDRKGELIKKEGPTGLIMTTTAAAVDTELETRCLTIGTDDSTEQTRRVFGVFADLEDEIESPVDFEQWHDLQEWIAVSGATRAVVPFVRPLAELMPVSATRLRRDFVTLLCLIRAHAILHQQTREKDRDGRVIATLDDYAAVSSLVGDLIAEGVDASVSAAMRQTVEAVEHLILAGGPSCEHISVKKLTDHLNVGQSATYDRVKRSLRAGYLVNKTQKDERGYKLALGAVMPGSEAFLPLPEEVLRVFPGAPTGNENGSTMPNPGDFSGIPGIPVDSPEKSGPVQGTNGANGRIPLPGDDNFLDHVVAAHRAGHLTNGEALEREREHLLVLQDHAHDDDIPLG